MAVAAIYIILAAAAFLLYLGFYKNDAWIIIFGSSMFIFIGLRSIIYGFEEIVYPYNFMFGVIFIFLGAYCSVRSGIEMIQENI